MENRAFIDSNLWVYALTESKRKEDLIKRQSVLNLLQLPDKTFIVSVQVLNEVHWNFVKKFNFKDDEAYYLIEKGIKAVSRVVPLMEGTYDLSFELRRYYQLSFWDSLIVASAMENECSIIYTEDMQHGLILKNTVKIINPFLC